MNNISQVTNFSPEVTSATIETIPVFIGNKKYINVDYYVLSSLILTKSSNTPINKLGYICEPKGIDYPIILTINRKVSTIYIGKTGIFELTPETFLNMNDEEAKEIECIPKISEIKIPKSVPGEEPIKFKLDYVFTIN